MRGLYTVLLLIGSNAFMTTAWYFHLKRPSWGWVSAILISWMVALPEYCLQVPANRLGHRDYGGVFSAPQLKVIQEVVTLLVFGVFTTLVLKERLRWTDGVAFALIVAAVGISMWGRSQAA